MIMIMVTTTAMMMRIMMLDGRAACVCRAGRYFYFHTFVLDVGIYELMMPKQRMSDHCIDR